MLLKNNTLRLIAAVIIIILSTFAFFSCEKNGVIGEDTNDSCERGHDYVKDVCRRCGDKRAVSAGLSYISNGDGTCCVSGIGSCTETRLVIPSVSDEGEAVVAINSGAFRSNTKIEEVIIPDGVKSILDEAFAFCEKLDSVIFPEGMIQIGIGTFYMCPVVSEIVIPDGVKSIGGAAFYGCDVLASVKIGKGVVEIGDFAFSACPSLEEIEVADGNTAYKVIDGALYTSDLAILVQYAVGRGNESFTVTDGVLAIGAGAFRGCESLCSISFHGSVISINPYAFDGCTGLSRVYYAATAPEWQKVEIGEGNTPITEARILYNFIS